MNSIYFISSQWTIQKFQIRFLKNTYLFPSYKLANCFITTSASRMMEWCDMKTEFECSTWISLPLLDPSNCNPLLCRTSSQNVSTETLTQLGSPLPLCTLYCHAWMPLLSILQALFTHMIIDSYIKRKTGFKTNDIRRGKEGLKIHFKVNWKHR